MTEPFQWMGFGRILDLAGVVLRQHSEIMSGRVAVIGGGLAGSLAAMSLRAVSGCTPVVFDSGKRVGGRVGGGSSAIGGDNGMHLKVGVVCMHANARALASASWKASLMRMHPVSAV